MCVVWTVWNDSTERRGEVAARSGCSAVTREVEARKNWMSLFKRQEKWRGWSGVLSHVGTVSWPWEKL